MDATTLARCVLLTAARTHTHTHSCARLPVLCRLNNSSSNPLFPRRPFHFTRPFPWWRRAPPRSPGGPPFLSSLSLSLSVPSGVDGVALEEGGGRRLAGSSAAFTAVLLGWLGAEEKHLKRYAEMYRSRGMRVMTVVISPKELLVRLDLGWAVQRRVEDFTKEIVAAVMEEEEREGRESFLFFHTFSNTGWITYGAILDNLQLQSRVDIIEKIKGCIVDSGADSNVNPQVWAVGFGAALLKKSSSSLRYSLNDSNKEEKVDNYANNVNKQDFCSRVTEMLLLAILQTFFTLVLKVPDVTTRLERVLSILSKNQPPLCPQLYLYSSADKVIPFEAIEYFIEKQKASGKTVRAYNFISSHHVDHLRTFPDVYSAEVGKFLDECVAAIIDTCVS